jgi:hypothetical protein
VREWNFKGISYNTTFLHGILFDCLLFYKFCKLNLISAFTLCFYLYIYIYIYIYIFIYRSNISRMYIIFREKRHTVVHNATLDLPIEMALSNIQS